MVTVRILVSPGMSKAREPEKRREKEPALAVRGGPSERFLNFGLLRPAGLAESLFRGGQRVVERTRGAPGSSEPLESRRGKHLVLLSPLQ